MCCKFNGSFNGVDCVVIAVDGGHIGDEYLTSYKALDRVFRTWTNAPCTSDFRSTNEAIQLIRQGLIVDFSSLEQIECQAAHAAVEAA